MKRTFIVVFCTLSGFAGIAQQTKAKEQQYSNAEKFSERSGSLIQKEFVDIGKVRKCELKVVHYIDLINNQKTSALKFEYEYASSYSSDTKAAVLDGDEIDGFIKSITIIQERILPSAPVNYTEVSFSGRDGFAAGCFYSKDKWSAYMQLEKYDSHSFIVMDKDDLSKLLTLLQQAAAQIK